MAAAWPRANTIQSLVEPRPGPAGFEKAIQKVAYGLASDGQNSLHPYYMAVLPEWSDMWLPSIFTIAEPLFRLLAKRAGRKGIHRELEARHYR